MINSRTKGKTAELEIAHKLNELFPKAKARRGQQHSGGYDSPDIKHDLAGIYFEVKRREVTPNLEEVLKKAQKESPNDIPMVLHRKSREPWKVTLYLEQLPLLVEKLKEF